MRHLTSFLIVAIVAALLFPSCNSSNKKVEADSLAITEAEEDTTLYGICGPNTSMHFLELIVGKGDTLTMLIDDENIDDSVTYHRNIVLGGLLSGDAMAVIANKAVDGTLYANTVINLKTLEGKWTNPDMINSVLEIVEDGTIVSTANIEKTPYTEWHIHNGKLIMSNDTFTINSLGADSLEIESSKGVYLYKRLK